MWLLWILRETSYPLDYVIIQFFVQQHFRVLLVKLTSLSCTFFSVNNPPSLFITKWVSSYAMEIFYLKGFPPKQIDCKKIISQIRDHISKIKVSSVFHRRIHPARRARVHQKQNIFEWSISIWTRICSRLSLHLSKSKTEPMQQAWANSRVKSFPVHFFMHHGLQGCCCCCRVCDAVETEIVRSCDVDPSAAAVVWWCDELEVQTRGR